MLRLIFSRKLIIFLISFFIFPADYLFLKLNAEINFEDKKNLEIYNIQNNQYLLGTGDIINIKFMNLEELSGNYEVMTDGNVNLPIIDNVNLNYLSLPAAKSKIENLYKDEIINPDVFISLIRKKPLRVSITGEVTKPGIYVFNKIKSRTDLDSENPTLVDLIQESGGFTKNANLIDVQLLRRYSTFDNDYDLKKASINIKELIQNGSHNNNPYLMNGDIVKIKYVENTSNEHFELNKSNLSPDSIKVSVIGQVNKPGYLEIASNTPLVQAIYLAGGPTDFKGNKKDIKLVRINENGLVTRTKYKSNLTKSVSEKDNPILENGDIIIVGKTNLSRGIDNLKEVTSPFIGIGSVINVIKLLD